MIHYEEVHCKGLKAWGQKGKYKLFRGVKDWMAWGTVAELGDLLGPLVFCFFFNFFFHLFPLVGG